MENTKVKIGDIRDFFTGCTKLPTTGFTTTPVTHFTDESALPSASTCDCSITFLHRLGVWTTTSSKLNWTCALKIHLDLERLSAIKLLFVCFLELTDTGDTLTCISTRNAKYSHSLGLHWLHPVVRC